MTFTKHRAKQGPTFALTFAGALLLAGTALAVPVLPDASGKIVGTRDSFDLGIEATGPWTDGGLILDYEITVDAAGVWTYQYSFIDDDFSGDPGVDPPLDLLILEVSASIDAAGSPGDPIGPVTLLGGGIDVTVNGPQTFAAGSSPGLPADIYGIELATGTSAANYTYTFLSTRSPIWGNFYAFGTNGPNNDPIWAYNTGFTSSPEGATDFTPFVPVPDTTNGGAAPEPGSLLLVGLALLGIGLRRSTVGA